MRLGLLSIGLVLGGSHMLAQDAPCGLAKMTDEIQATYPPIGRVAHVEGVVVLIASFAPNGDVVESHVITGSPILVPATTAYVSAWKANATTGVRNCPVVVTYKLTGTSVECGTPEDRSAEPPIAARIDVQHVTLSAPAPCFIVTRDPAPWRVHHFLWHTWYSKSA